LNKKRYQQYIMLLIDTPDEPKRNED